tara:strand:+ start:6085 stop:6420 length:336 start_codon:yes stop_codon:yes gene_type:complete
MAESIARYHGHEAYSGGTEPGNSVSENAIEALVERGYSTEGLIPKSIDLVYPGDYDMIISMGCGVSCPNIPINEDWELEDPVGRDLEVFRSTRDEIFLRISKMAKDLSTDA